jgi:hypothetical protein
MTEEGVPENFLQNQAEQEPVRGRRGVRQADMRSGGWRAGRRRI